MRWAPFGPLVQTKASRTCRLSVTEAGCIAHTRNGKMQRFFIGRLILALAFAVLSLLISPIGIKLITGREDLTFRVSLLGLCFAAFLLVLAIAIASIGRLRQLMFYVFVIMLPVIFFAVLETAAIALHLADRVALAEDNSVYERRGRWPAHLMSDARMFNTDGLRLYRPWQGDGVVINDLGLRTQRPQTKQAGEWRIAITGGSTAWGWRVGDEDTIAAQLARALQRHGYKNVSVYNFGIEGAELKSELALLKRFKEIYAIDQAIFYTGGNNVLICTDGHGSIKRPGSQASSFSRRGLASQRA